MELRHERHKTLPHISGAIQHAAAGLAYALVRVRRPLLIKEYENPKNELYRHGQLVCVSVCLCVV